MAFDGSHVIHSQCPVVRRGPLALREPVTVGGEYRLLPFEREVLWLRETRSEIRLAHRGVTIDEQGARNDFYGLCSSVREAVTDCVAYAGRAKIDATATLDVVVDVRVLETPVLADASAEAVEENERRRARGSAVVRYRSVPDRAWYVGDEPEPRAWLKPVVVKEVVAAWSFLADAGDPMPPRLRALLTDWRAEVGLGPLEER
ncbi:MAG TPA: hypothetical protein VF796_26770 [Humisphaera sp.]